MEEGTVIIVIVTKESAIINAENVAMEIMDGIITITDGTTEIIKAIDLIITGAIAIMGMETIGATPAT